MTSTAVSGRCDFTSVTMVLTMLEKGSGSVWLQDATQHNTTDTTVSEGEASNDSRSGHGVADG